MCKISRSFQLRKRNEIVEFGLYKPGILFGSFSDEDVALILAYAVKCNYQAEIVDSKQRTIRIANKLTGHWGWIKKLWACIDPVEGLYSAQFVYGFFQEGTWRSKYSINETLISLAERIQAKRTQDQLDNSKWPYIVYLPELEPPTVRQKIAQIRGSKLKTHEARANG